MDRVASHWPRNAVFGRLGRQPAGVGEQAKPGPGGCSRLLVGRLRPAWLSLRGKNMRRPLRVNEPTGLRPGTTLLIRTSVSAGGESIAGSGNRPRWPLRPWLRWMGSLLAARPRSCKRPLRLGGPCGSGPMPRQKRRPSGWATSQACPGFRRFWPSPRNGCRKASTIWPTAGPPAWMIGWGRSSGCGRPSLWRP